MAFFKATVRTTFAVLLLCHRVLPKQYHILSSLPVRIDQSWRLFWMMMGCRWFCLYETISIYPFSFFHPPPNGGFGNSAFQSCLLLWRAPPYHIISGVHSCFWSMRVVSLWHSRCFLSKSYNLKLTPTFFICPNIFSKCCEGIEPLRTNPIVWFRRLFWYNPHTFKTRLSSICRFELELGVFFHFNLRDQVGTVLSILVLEMVSILNKESYADTYRYIGW